MLPQMLYVWELRQFFYLLLALDEGLQHRPPGSSQRVCSHPRQLDVGILQHRLNPVGDSIALLRQVHPIARQSTRRNFSDSKRPSPR